MADLALPAAHRTGLRLGAGFGAGAGARFAGDRSWDADRRSLAGIGFQQRDLHVVAQVRAALASGAAAAATVHAEEIVEYIGEGSGEVSTKSVRSADAAVLECSMTETVISGPLVGVFEDLVGLVDLLEAMLGAIVPGITIRMTLHRLLAKGGLDVAVTGGAFDR